MSIMLLSMTTTLTSSGPTIPRKLGLVKRRLRRAGISQWAVAQAAGITDVYVWQMLNGRRRLSPRVMATIERLLAEAKP